MALFIRRLIGRKVNVGLMHPRELANESYNPIFEYLDTQYGLVAAGELPKSAMEILDGQPSGTDVNWWHTDFDVSVTRELQNFLNVVNEIKAAHSATYSQVQRMRTAGVNCAKAMCNQYLQYAFLYEIVKHQSPSGPESGSPYSTTHYWTDYFNPVDWFNNPTDIEISRESAKEKAKLDSEQELRVALEKFYKNLNDRQYKKMVGID